MPTEDHVIHLKNGRLAPSTPRAKITQMAEQAVASGHLVIHFHGGLVSHDAGIEIVERLLPRYSGAGAYPLFFVWESGLIETISNNFKEIAQERLFRILWKRIAAIVKRKFSQTNSDRAGFVLPHVDTGNLERTIDKSLDEDNLSHLAASELATPANVEELGDFERMMLENELGTDAQLNLEIQKVSNSLRDPADVAADMQSRGPRVQGSSTTMMDPRALDQLVDRPIPGHRGIISTAKMIKAIVSIAASVISRFVKNRDHGFHATVVEEILRELYLANVGQFIWETMKEDTADAFGDNSDVHGGTALLDSLLGAIDPATPPKITLVGHSTGAVYISKFLDKAAGLLPENQRYDVIFLAPASNCQLTADTLTLHGSKIGNFRMFTMTDHYEKNDRLVKILYPHSLLYFVSGVVEGGFDVPIVGMARFYENDSFPDADFPAVATVRDYIEADSDRAVWSVNDAGPGGHRSASRKHGDFDNDPKTVESIEHILAQGF
ncbi:MAG: hypothetical protein DRR42_15880 [Gammaproteobacteria bacterium]|nr:MAG: hypothetical protein DRR42_15880 [Gammaproteobacteria bacterium]